jgi:hypothetical protein
MIKEIEDWNLLPFYLQNKKEYVIEQLEKELPEMEMFNENKKSHTKTIVMPIYPNGFVNIEKGILYWRFFSQFKDEIGKFFYKNINLFWKVKMLL